MVNAIGDVKKLEEFITEVGEIGQWLQDRKRELKRGDYSLPQVIAYGTVRLGCREEDDECDAWLNVLFPAPSDGADADTVGALIDSGQYIISLRFDLSVR